MGLETATYVSQLDATWPLGSDQKLQGDNHLRLLKAAVQASLPSLDHAVYLERPQADVASAAGPDIAAATTQFVRITGTTTITSFASAAAGIVRQLRFAGILTFTHNGTSLILPTGANITTAANDTALMVSLGSGNWMCLGYHKADGSALAVSATTMASLTDGDSWTAEASVASASTCDILGAASDFIVISGTTTITSFGTGTNKIRFVRFSGALTLTHNASSLILRDGVNITTVAGDTCIVISDGSSNCRVYGYQTASGKQSIWVPASAMTARTTNGAASGTAEMTTNKNMVRTLDFDSTTQEFAQFDIRMPKGWNESTVTFIPLWSHPATTTNFGVVWGLDAVAISDNETLDVAFGTAQTSTDTGGTTDKLYQAPESSAITIAGSPAENDYVQYRVHRDPANGSDTMAVDARLHGVLVLFTRNILKDD